MDRIERSAAVEATQEARAAADTLAHRIRGWDNTEQHKEDVAAILEYRQAAFNAGRASVLAELESNECICPKCGIRHGGRVGEGDF